MREKIEAALDKYVDKHRPKLHEHIDNCVEWLKGIISEHLPHHVVEYIKKHSDDGDGIFEVMSQVITQMSDQMSGDFKDEIREVTREHLDKITVNTSDDLTTVVVRESKNAVAVVTRKKEKNDDESWWKEIDFSFLKGGKEGIIAKFLEFVKPHVQRSGDDIKEHVSTHLPEHVKRKLTKKIGITTKNRDDSAVRDRGIHFHQGGFAHILDKIAGKEEEFISKTFDKIFNKLPEKIQEFLEPHIREFVDKLMDLLHIEIRENVFKEDHFLGGLKSMLNVDKDGDGKNDFIQAVESFFHHKNK
ncbi:6348_t:CDS:1 [Dentiscutata erythropus]|uniref:6348_t:CDS:1 n=1 Tax=Dentiscutata erythropus TaxID=1348616 RepID=A0A9N9DUK2_9GLOM|nr:6348_t:CDS:1 [Dentiscutata erythropus]